MVAGARGSFGTWQARRDPCALAKPGLGNPGRRRSRPAQHSRGTGPRFLAAEQEVKRRPPGSGERPSHDRVVPKPLSFPGAEALAHFSLDARAFARSQ